MVLGDSTLEPLTPSVNVPLVEIFSPEMSNLKIIGDTASLSIKNWPVLSFVYLGCFSGVIFH
jgi:hypothetical protein